MSPLISGLFFGRKLRIQDREIGILKKNRDMRVKIENGEEDAIVGGVKRAGGWSSLNSWIEKPIVLAR